MKLIENGKFPHERDLYAADGLLLRHCDFDGEEDGESALKEAKNIALEDCLFNLRYPLWHDDSIRLRRIRMTDNCRAALWYSQNIEISDCNLSGIKALRECSNINIENSKISSPEFGWKSKNIAISQCDITGEYFLLMAENVTLKNTRFQGKYSFQYTRNVTIESCELDTKDAFWHCDGVTVKNSVVKGEYLGWYSENLTFINCKIIGTQPLCYCKNLTLVNCQMTDTDLAFEYSAVNATVSGNVLSVKNPRSGRIAADSIGDIIITKDSKYACNCEIICDNKRQ